MFLRFCLKVGPIVLLVLLFFLIGRESNWWGSSKGLKDAKKNVKSTSSFLKKKMLQLKAMSFLTGMYSYLGFKASNATIFNLKYYINRLEIKLKYLDRAVSPIEILGLFKIVKFAGVAISIVLVIVTGNKLFLGVMVLSGVGYIFDMYAKLIIDAEDALLEVDFPDLYTYLYPNLQQSGNAPIAPVLKEYLETLDTLDPNKFQYKGMRKLVYTLRNNIEIYGDEAMAVSKIRDKYNSATILNFCSIAVQSLSGTNNRDKLISFKAELDRKRVEAMQKKAEQLVVKGRRSLVIIYIILAECVIISWISKLGGSAGLGQMLKMFQ